VDWDTGTIGDPLLDLGHLLGRWTEPGEEPLVASPDAGRPHYPSRAELAQRYGEATGRDLRALPYYEVLALFKLAAILEGRYVMERSAGVPDHHNSMAELVPRLLRGAAAFARGARR
jgi:aminoglycoside phosphotransferase (APT) family kinase protein